MKKIIIILIAALLLLTTVSIIAVAGGGDENYNDHSNEYAQGEQPDPEDIPGMNRDEDRTRNKDN